MVHGHPLSSSLFGDEHLNVSSVWYESVTATFGVEHNTFFSNLTLGTIKFEDTFKFVFEFLPVHLCSLQQCPDTTFVLNC